MHDIVDTSTVTRVEVIDPRGRAYVAWDTGLSVHLQVQDENRTLKIFIADGADGADEIELVREIHDALPFAHFMEGRMVDIVDRLREPSFHHMAIMDEAADLIVELRGRIGDDSR